MGRSCVVVRDPRSGAPSSPPAACARLPDADRDRGLSSAVRKESKLARGECLMYSIVAGGGKVGANVARSLLTMGHEVTLIEQRPYRFEQLQDEFEHQVLLGDATELHVLERAGIARPPGSCSPSPATTRTT